jgi:threonine dehydrogenase-like Zn-dependent dehydrogenase
MQTMKAVVFLGKDRIARGEYPVKPGLILGHEPVGVIEELGPGLETLYAVGQRVIVGAIAPCGQCFYCLNGVHSQCGGAATSKWGTPSQCSRRDRSASVRRWAPG